MFEINPNNYEAKLYSDGSSAPVAEPAKAKNIEIQFVEKQEGGNTDAFVRTESPDDPPEPDVEADAQKLIDSKKATLDQISRFLENYGDSISPEMKTKLQEKETQSAEAEAQKLLKQNIKDVDPKYNRYFIDNYEKMLSNDVKDALEEKIISYYETLNADELVAKQSWLNGKTNKLIPEAGVGFGYNANYNVGAFADAHAGARLEMDRIINGKDTTTEVYANGFVWDARKRSLSTPQRNELNAGAEVGVKFTREIDKDLSWNVGAETSVAYGQRDRTFRPSYWSRNMYDVEKIETEKAKGVVGDVSLSGGLEKTYGRDNQLIFGSSVGGGVKVNTYGEKPQFLPHAELAFSLTYAPAGLKVTGFTGVMENDIGDPEASGLEDQNLGLNTGVRLEWDLGTIAKHKRR